MNEIINLTQQDDKHKNWKWINSELF